MNVSGILIVAKKSTVKKRTQGLKDLLIEQKRKILADVRRAMEDSLGEDVRMSFEACQDNADKSVDELLKHVNAAITGNRSEEIDKIDEALTKLKEGTYGVCEECGCDIPVKRLEAVPYATCCVVCQNELERVKQKGDEGMQKRDKSEDSNDYLPEEE